MLTHDMKRLTDDIVALHDTRVSFLNTLIHDTSEMLNSFRSDHSKMALDQKKKLEASYRDLKSTVEEFLTETHQKKKQLRDETFRMLEEHEDSRLANARDMKKRLIDFTNQITEEIENLLKSYGEFRTQMASDQKSSLMDFTNQLASDTATLLKNFSNAHSEMAKALREMLETDNHTRKTEVAGFMEELAKAHEEMAKELNGFLTSNETTRKNQFKEMMESISTRLSELRTRTHQVLESSDELMKEFGKDRKGMAEAWSELNKLMKNQRAMGQKKVKKIKEEEMKKQQQDGLKTSVMGIISQSKNSGIKLTQIGKELGRPWQSLIPWITELVDEGAVTKDEKGFYH